MNGMGETVGKLWKEQIKIQEPEEGDWGEGYSIHKSVSHTTQNESPGDPSIHFKYPINFPFAQER